MPINEGDDNSVQNLVYEPEYEGPPDSWTFSFKVSKTKRKNGCRDITPTDYLHQVLKLRMSGSMGPFLHTPLCPVLQYGPVRHNLGILCSFSYADLTVNTQRHGDVAPYSYQYVL
jgi:hypothetical protein